MNDPQSPEQKPGWERQTLEKLAFAALQEQRARRRWGIFFKLLGFAYLAFVLIAVVDWGGDAGQNERHTALVELNGVIAAKGEANAENIVSALDSAFAAEHAAGVILRINSPGGSPVQAGIVYDEIKRLRGKYPDKPLYVVVEDICASGGYYVAAAADKIYVDKASLVGSIGVLMDGFGFTGTMEKLGVERRLLTAGENKGFLDPFSPQEEKQRQYAQQLLNDIHQQFIDVVKAGRGSRLKEDAETFSGLVWTGKQSVERGLADAYGTVDSVARDVLKAEKVLDYSVKDNIAERFAKRFGASTFAGFWQGFFQSAASAPALR
ncbi:MAG: S49 family peptidase [Azonexus sp.]|jgi:protease-4|nr:S49 family peptidase [Azonexus sp.]